MNVECKRYRIGGHTVEVRLQDPWTFKALNEKQVDLVERLRRGEDIGVETVPADRVEQLSVNEELMGKEAMTRARWDAMDAGERDAFRHALDFLQYAPFEVPEGEPLFTLTVHAGIPEGFEATRPGWTPVTAVEDVPPFYYGYLFEGKTIYDYMLDREHRAGYFVMEEGYREGHYYPAPDVGGRTTLFQLNTSLMIQYTFATAGLGTLLLHASVTRYEGRGNLFFGVSGTGKSTHTGLWLKHIPGTDLMNDDNPVVRFCPDGVARVYGSPWSGKTPCYRNVEAPIGAFLQLKQAPYNRISRMGVTATFASLLPSCSVMKWDERDYVATCDTVGAIMQAVPTYLLECLPDEAACRLSYETIHVKGRPA